jgi:hypothetical protein
MLQRTTVGRDDNFFDLGGNSLLLASVHTRLVQALGIGFSVTTLFENPTIRLLAARLEAAATGAAEPPRSGPRRATGSRTTARSLRDLRRHRSTGQGEAR